MEEKGAGRSEEKDEKTLIRIQLPEEGKIPILRIALFRSLKKTSLNPHFYLVRCGVMKGSIKA